MINYNTRRRLVVAAVVASAGALTLGFAGAASADAGGGSTVVVTPSTASAQGWYSADTRPGGTITYVSDSTAPGGAALQLATDNTNAAKAQYLHNANVPLSSVTELSYETSQVAASSSTGDASFQLPVDTSGSNVPGCSTTLVYEPYWQNNGNPDPAPVVPTQWQSWNVETGLFWSSQTVSGACGGNPTSSGLIAGAGGKPFYTLSQVEQMFPNAVLQAFGVNVGSYNPSYTINVDLIDFNGTTYNFQLTNVPTSKDQCKNGGYANYTDASGNTFKNQGQCVSYSNHENGHGNG